MPGANLAVGKNSKNALVSSRVPKLENYFITKNHDDLIIWNLCIKFWVWLSSCKLFVSKFQKVQLTQHFKGDGVIGVV